MRDFINGYGIRGLKYIIITASILFFIGYVLPVVLLNIPFVQRNVTDMAENELSELLGASVKTGAVDVSWLNRIVLRDVRIDDQKGETLLEAGNITAGFKLLPALKGRFILTTVRFFGISCHIKRDTPESETNLQFILDALSKSPRGNGSGIELQVHSIHIRRSSITYDVLNRENTGKQFNPGHIHVRNISGKLSLRHYGRDSIDARVDRLSFDEISGLNVNRLSMNITAGKDTAHVGNLTLRLPHSSVSVPSAGIRLSGVDSLPELLDRALLTVNIAPSRILPEDFSAFLPFLRDFPDVIDFSANISGSANDISLNRLDLQYGTAAAFSGNMELKGLTGRNEELYVLGQVRKLNVTAGGLREIYSRTGSHPALPEALMRLEKLEFTGEISGFTNHLVTFGNLSSPIGSVRMDMLIGSEKNAAIYLKGNVASSELRISDLFDEGNPYGKARFSAEIDIAKPAGQNVSGSVKAQVNEFDYNGYSYENIHLSVNFMKNEYRGLVHVNDPNGKIEFQGLFRNEGEKSLFDFMANIRNVRPDRLHLTDRYENPEVSFGINANFTGNSPDDFDGYIELEDLSISTSGDSLSLNGLRLETSADERPYKRTRISSDMINGEITGLYSFSSLAGDLLRTSGIYLPSLTGAFGDGAGKGENRFDFLFTVENTETVSDMLKLPAAFLRKSTVRGQYNSAANILHADIDAPLFSIGKTMFENGRLHLDNAGDSLNVELTASQNYKGNTHNYIRLESRAKDDVIDATLFWTNDKENRYEAEIRASALFVRENDAGKLRTEITIPQAQIILKDSLWNIEPASVTLSGGHIHVDNFYVTKGGQYLHIDGLISDNPKDLLLVDLNDIEISHIFDVLNIPSLQFGGRATGSVNASDLAGSMMLEGRLEVREFSFNQAVQGNLSLSSEWDGDRQGILLIGSIYHSDSVWTDVNGYIFPIGENRGLSLYFDANEINIAFLRKYMDSFADDISGRLFGNVHLYGSFSHIFLEGTPYVRDGKVKVSLLNTEYSFSDTVTVSESAIRTENTVLSDRNGNTGLLNFDFTHNSFRDMKYDLDIKVSNLLVYDVSEHDNPEIYGQVYASGAAVISGTEDFIRVGGNVRSDAGTSAGFNFAEKTAAESYDFISFVEKQEDSQPGADSGGRRDNGTGGGNGSSMDYQLDFMVNVTPDAKLELTVDPSSNDRIRGSGSGDIRIQYGSQNDVQMFGNYLISDGTYNFSLQQVIRKRFNIRDGGIVTFHGDPMTANLSISAIYSLTANIQDLDETFLLETANPSIPVNCVLKLDGRLQNPAITFDLELPSSNSEMERQVKSFIDTEDMMTRQIIYLLVLNKFYTPDYSRNDYRSNEFSAVASSALSAQLSSILGSLTDKVQIGTNIRSRQDGIKDTEVEMLLSSRLLNNRLLFNGNFGYKDNTIMTNAFVGEFDLEYKLSRNRDISLKAYNHANDLYRYNTKSLTRQGVGVTFRRDFSSLSDIFTGKRREEEE
ncbi:MAG: translocation/assembly module TamB [Tannerella sp.]|nr:translocation/assembly module TamB [Tannerella sp.]